MEFEPRRPPLRPAPCHALRLALVAAIGALSLASACSKTGDDVAPPTVPLADGGTLAVPVRCQPDAGVVPAQSAPFQIEFHFRNQGSAPLFYRGGCGVDFAVGSCAAGFNDDLTRLGASGCDCEFRGQCPVGGPCQPLPGFIGPGQDEIITWTAIARVRSTVAGMECSQPVVLPAGVYEIRLPLYADLASSQDGVPVRTVRHTFTLPSADRTIDVPITP
jgi:hypothetical protein